MDGFENAMDLVNSALEKFGGPFFLGSKVLYTIHACIHSLAFPVQELVHEIGLPMSVVFLGL